MTTTATSVKNQTREVFGAIPNFLALKVPTTLIVGAAGWLFGSQNVEMVGILTAMIALDLITAIISEFKQGNPIESRKALKTVTKTVVYGTMVAGAHLCGKVIGVTFLDGAVTSFLAVTEFISILENIGKAGYSIPNVLLNRLQMMKEE